MIVSEERTIEGAIMTGLRRAAAHAMADMARFYVALGASLYYEKQAPEYDTAELAKVYERIDGCHRQYSRMGLDFEEHIVEDTLDVLLDGVEYDDEGRKFARGFVDIALVHYNRIHDQIAQEEASVTEIAEARIAARLAVGDALEDNGVSDYEEARRFVDAASARNGLKRLAELKERNRIFLNAVTQAA
jgi:hypothetical protein